MECKPLIVVSGMAFEARMAAGPDIHTLWGLDPIKLTRDMVEAIKGGACGLLSFGTAAGLSPILASGAIVIAREVKHGTQSFLANSAWVDALARHLPEATVRAFAGVDTPLASERQKSELFAQTGAVAADMESHHVARIAQAHGLPFAVLRFVLDDAKRALPPAALAATRKDGSINYVGLTGSLLAHPSQLPALLRLAGDQAKAKKSLLRCGELLRHNRLGLGLGLVNIG
jgi:hopanoid-associated phosphorylase